MRTFSGWLSPVSRNGLALAFYLCIGSHLLCKQAIADTTFEFPESSYELAASQKESLSALAEQWSSKKTGTFTIREPIQGLKSSSLSYIVERNRGLRIFQELVRLGVNPASIKFESIPSNAGAGRLAVVYSSGENSAPLSKIIPSDQAIAAGPKDFTINFPSASAETANLGEDRFKQFLSSVGQPGRDAIVIEGYTDTVGNAKYNKALGEFRALTVYAKLVNSGLPQYRVDTQSMGMSAAKKKGDSAEDRKVVIRWTQNAKIAEEAKKEEAPPEPKQETQPISKPEVVKEETEPVPDQEKPSTGFDLVPFLGSSFPVGDLGKHAKPAFLYGIGVGKALYTDADTEFRATFYVGASVKHEAKESDRAGPLRVQPIFLRADYGRQLGSIRPYAGLGVGSYRWKGSIVQPSTERQNLGNNNDVGGVLSIGLDHELARNIFLEPELTWHAIQGDFSESLVFAQLSLRWRI